MSAPLSAAELATGRSSYLNYLPPVLWEDGDSSVTLASTLRIVEKLLTGLDDGVPLSHPALSTEIANLHRLYDPWTAPPDFLTWLASWVALDFPTLRGVPIWEEYQRRAVTAEIAPIYRQRGLKAGLNKYVELYATGHTQPRVALDDGTRLLSLTPRAGTAATATAVVSQGPVVLGTSVRAEGLTRPWCATTASDGSLLVGDIGIPAGASVQLRSRVWHLDASGHVDAAGTPPQPAPLAAGSLALNRAVAIAVTPGAGATPETVYVLDRNGRLFGVPTPWTSASVATQVATLAAGGTTLWPVAMAVDQANGDLLVLERGDGPGTPNPPKVITVRPSSATITRNNLTNVQEPLSLWVEADGTLLVGDGGDQAPTTPGGLVGQVYRVDRPAGWTVTPVLPTGHPIVAPTGVARLDDGRLFVLDAGLKPFAPTSTDPFICTVADPAAVYEVDLAPTNPSVTRISEPGLLVYPTGMSATGDRLLVCDPGQPDVAGLQPFWSRIRPFTFAVVVHFVESRLPTSDTERRRVLSQAVSNIRTVIDAEKPAHTVWNLITAI